MSMVFKINLYPSIEKQERRMLGDTTEFQLRFIYFVLVVLKTEKKNKRFYRQYKYIY